MAEKRAKDRVILKLIGVAGFVYSEDEADDFKESRPQNMGGAPQPQAEPPKQTPEPPALEDIPFNENPWRDWVDQEKTKIKEMVNLGALQAWGRNSKKQREDLQEADRELYTELFDHYNNHFESLNSGVR